MFEYYQLPRTTDYESSRSRTLRATEEYEIRRALRELDEKRRAERRAGRANRRSRRLPRLALKWLA